MCSGLVLTTFFFRGQLAGKWDPQAQTSASSDGVPAAGHVPARQPLFKHVSIPKGPTYNTRKHSSTPFVVRLPSSRLTMGQQRTSEEPPTGRKRRLDEEDDPRAPRRQKLDNSAPTSPARDVGHSSSDGPHPALRAHSDPPPSPRPDDHSSERAARIASLTHEAWEIRKQRIHLRELEEAIRSEFCFLNEVPPLDPVDLPDKHGTSLSTPQLTWLHSSMRVSRSRAGVAPRGGGKTITGRAGETNKGRTRAGGRRTRVQIAVRRSCAVSRFHDHL